MTLRLGLPLRIPYDRMRDVAVVAERLGLESVWLPDHLVLPAAASAETLEHAPIDPEIPVLDTLVVADRLAQATTGLRVGTWTYNLALRPVIVAARTVQTVALGSGGRLLLGVGAGWLPGEYAAAGVDFRTRGRRLDESIEALRTLLDAELPSYHGDHVSFPAVHFVPKAPPVPVLVGGDSDAALRRAVRAGDGWIGSYHTLDGARERVERLAALTAAAGRDGNRLEVTVAAPPDACPRTVEELDRWEEAGVDRLLVTPWSRSRDAVPELQRWAAALAGYGTVRAD
ncbi:TIGR03619 family F420-dependent LLM class oxidoreductase [Nocardioides sp. TF02-7]|uniref:TIGR03619 family F420-dependent LLM class oxidoreductase n=1 Tax=Nocardioides sp. TF02-7 TaxID=2917724 RepID=UPI001F052626|nr:TIGR03619 family F420-dependent LLM class oxidoreductase [Nocardioides sp. TF02-7]UMG91198.1 TIGR03619 family F420-dependent LLM class oxidoreductase [Nocardioides sp. TF02-7]